MSVQPDGADRALAKARGLLDGLEVDVAESLRVARLWLDRAEGCGGCHGLGAHRRWCPTVVGTAAKGTAPMARLIFLDTETTSLDRRTREIWDLAYIIRDDDHNDVEKQWFLPVSLREADPISLKIGNYYQRHPSPMHSRGDARSISNSLVDPHGLWREVASDLRDAIIVGAVPSFDEETIADTLHGRNGLQPTWHYHLVDIETLAAGALGMEPPWDFDEVLARYGLAQHDDRHTALGDARLVRDLYDAWKGQR